MEVTLQKSQLLGKVHRESLYPLYEQVFGIPAYILQDYFDKVYGIRVIVPILFLKKIIK
jgi:hypothetical protein